jgi:hypothetical protein
MIYFYVILNNILIAFKLLLLKNLLFFVCFFFCHSYYVNFKYNVVSSSHFIGGFARRSSPSSGRAPALLRMPSGNGQWNGFPPKG